MGFSLTGKSFIDFFPNLKLESDLFYNFDQNQKACKFREFIFLDLQTCHFFLLRYVLGRSRWGLGLAHLFLKGNP